MRFDFLMCSERSGSNLITKLLDAHPVVCGPFPTHIMGRFVPNLYRYGELTDDSRWRTLLDDVAFYLANVHSTWVTRTDADTLAGAVQRREFSQIVRFVYEREATAAGKQRLFVKENHAYRIASFIEVSFGGPKYVWLVRDPRDMALTWKRNVSARGGVDKAARVWKQDQAETLQLYGFLNNLGRMLLIRFEDLLANSEDTMRRVCRFLDLRYDPQMFDFHKKDIVRTNAGKLTSWTDLAKPLIRDNFNLYKTRLTEAEIRYVEGICRDEMAFFGYAPDFDDSIPLAELEPDLPAKQTEPMPDREKETYRRFREAMRRISRRQMYRR